MDKSKNDRFFGLGIAPGILELLARAKFKTPTPIQVKAIPLAIEGKDLQMTINTMLKRGQVRQSVTGKEEILIEIKTKAGSRPDGA